MAKTRTLPDKFYDKNYETNGIHRVPLWRIGCFALNNTATNLYLFLMNYATYYLMGWVGVGMMVASSLTMAMRIWDGVTDPFVGFMVDKTNGKFGKNRPFMVIGNILLAVTSFVAFHVTHNLPQAARFPFYVVVLMVYYLGYTCQCVVTKSAQSCLTNDPKQRPLFASFDGVYNTVLFAGLAGIPPPPPTSQTATRTSAAMLPPSSSTPSGCSLPSLPASSPCWLSSPSPRRIVLSSSAPASPSRSA